MISDKQKAAAQAVRAAAAELNLRLMEATAAGLTSVITTYERSTMEAPSPIPVVTVEITRVEAL